MAVVLATAAAAVSVVFAVMEVEVVALDPVAVALVVSGTGGDNPRGLVTGRTKGPDLLTFDGIQYSPVTSPWQHLHPPCQPRAAPNYE